MFCVKAQLSCGVRIRGGASSPVFNREQVTLYCIEGAHSGV